MADSAELSKLKLTEIFYSLQGESRTVGLPTIFIRLTGCPLRCQYCDTEYAFTGGKWWTFEEVLQEIKQYKTAHITVTGGEPLAQKPCIPFMTALCDAGYQVSIETSGAMDVSMIDSRVMKVMDIKTPDSKESERNLWDNLAHMRFADEVKFVICSRADYDWSKMMLAKHDMTKHTHVLFSPSHAEVSATDLADWILQDQLPVRMQVQLHKLLWGDQQGK